MCILIIKEYFKYRNMKVKMLNLLMISLFMLGCTVSNKNSSRDTILIDLSLIKIKDIKIDSLINELIKNNQYCSNKKCFFLVGINKRDKFNNVEVVVTCYEKEKFKLSCSKTDISLIGYSEINNQIILFIGKPSDIMKDTKEMKTFIFVCRKTGKEYPPSMYNPPTYKFLYKNTGGIDTLP